MEDAYGRKIEYLRISITDSCNLNCTYCRPAGVFEAGTTEALGFGDVVKVVRAAASLGIKYVKVTGGEPLIRKDCPGLIQALKAVPGIEKVTLTTNGLLLADRLEALTAAGVDGINISLDTADRERYRILTGHDSLARVMAGICQALEGPVPIKVNCVAMKNFTDWHQIVLLAKTFPLDVRFIEMMPLGAGCSFETMDSRWLLKQMEAMYPGIEADTSVHGPGPARYYRIPGFKGAVGFISAVHKGFCGECNRIRVTWDGFLKPCLCYGEKTDLKPGLAAAGDETVKRVLKAGIWQKPEVHCFDRPEDVSERRGMREIGG